MPATRAIEELEPAVQAFVEATGLLGPVREFAAWATDLIRYRRAPHQAKLLLRAAEKIKQSGLPPQAVEDRLLRAVLEDGAMEDDADMQERWASLLAKAGTSSARVHAAFPRMLSEMEPHEAALLEAVSQAFESPGRSLRIGPGDDFAALGNLKRLGLLIYTYEPMLNVGEARITALGQTFVQACHTPDPVM